MNSQSIIVPKISTLPVHEPRARAIVRWLVRKNIIEEELTTLLPYAVRMSGLIYLASAVVLNAGFLYYAWKMYRCDRCHEL